MNFESATENEENPKGYKPLELEYHDGHLWMSDGVRFDPDFPVGPERWQIDLFIEYERTFGRGKAFEITHGITEESQDPEIVKRYGGDSMIYDFQELAFLVPNAVALTENKSSAKGLTRRLREFRKKYPQLYEDADQHQSPGHQY